MKAERNFLGSSSIRLVPSIDRSPRSRRYWALWRTNYTRAVIPYWKFSEVSTSQPDKHRVPHPQQLVGTLAVLLLLKPLLTALLRSIGWPVFQPLP